MLLFKITIPSQLEEFFNFLKCCILKMEGPVKQNILLNTKILSYNSKNDVNPEVMELEETDSNVEKMDSQETENNIEESNVVEDLEKNINDEMIGKN